MTIAELVVGFAWLAILGSAVVTVRCIVHIARKRARRVEKLSLVAFGLVSSAVLVNIVGFIQTTRGSDENTAFSEALPGCLFLAVLIGAVIRTARIIAAKNAPGEDEHAAVPPIRLTRGTARYLTLLGAFLLTFPLSFVVMNGLLLREWKEVQSWPEHPALIERVDLDEHWTMSTHEHSSRLVYRLKGAYRYQVDGSTFEGTRLSLYPASDNGAYSRKLFVRLNQARSAQQKMPCYVNPLDPSDSVLVRDLWIPKLIKDALGSILLLTLGVWLIRFSRNAPRAE